jgi:hypothetical protein
MTKIYLIKHLDSGMKYVGITDGDLAKRWQQHYNDPNSAVYSALRSEGYRMTMELLDDVPSRDEALRKEQEYIRTLGTAQPHGWNRMVSKVEKPKQMEMKSRTIDYLPYGELGRLKCPHCDNDRVHLIREHDAMVVAMNHAKDYIQYFYCEECHHSDVKELPPPFWIHIYEVRGYLYVDCTYHYMDSADKDVNRMPKLPFAHRYVYEAIKNGNKSFKQILGALPNMSKTHVSNVLTLMVKNGVIERMSWGEYAINDKYKEVTA